MVVLGAAVVAGGLVSAVAADDAVLNSAPVEVGIVAFVEIGQSVRVHGTTCESEGQAAPPFEGVTSTVRVTVVTPDPQVTEHG